MTRERLQVGCGVTAAASSCKPGGWLHTSETSFSDRAASSAVSAAARLTCSGTLAALSLSLSSFHAARPQALHARYPPWARASSCTTCTHASVPMVRTSAPLNAGVDEDDFTCGDPSKAEAFVDEPLVDNELHDFGPVCEGVWEAGFAFFVFLLGVPSQAAQAFSPPHPPSRRASFPDARGTQPFGGSLAGLGSNPRFAPLLPWPGGVSHLPPC